MRIRSRAPQDLGFDNSDKLLFDKTLAPISNALLFDDGCGPHIQQFMVMGAMAEIEACLVVLRSYLTHEEQDHVVELITAPSPLEWLQTQVLRHMSMHVIAVS